jgi:hypothetical protein
MMERAIHNSLAVLARIQAYLRGWRSADKILVIESDDWGSIRTSSAAAYRRLVARGYAMERSCWSVDALETDEDLEALYGVLERFRDARGRPACITANMVMANPDFAAIRRSGFEEYVYEPAASTLAASSERQNVAALWREGMQRRLFRPQFHAREHVRWRAWLGALRSGSAEALETLDLGMCGVPRAVSKEKQSFFEPVYIGASADESRALDVRAMVREGVRLFEGQFGFRSLSTVAPNCVWTDTTEQAWAESGVRYIQGAFLQYGQAGRRPRGHYLGQRTRHNGRYLVRNATFEPARQLRGEPWRGCLAQIARAFRFGIPAIVSSHRVNYVGSIVAANRKRGLDQLGRLLASVVSRWPEVHFLSSAELGYMIEHDIRRAGGLDGSGGGAFPPAGGVNAGLCDVRQGG